MKQSFVQYVVILSLFAFGPGVEARSVKYSVERVIKGRALFLENCIGCHGEIGDGQGPAANAIKGPKPRNFTSGNFKRGSRPHQIFNTISNGSSGSMMPAWKEMLTEDERWSLVFYVQALGPVHKRFPDF